MTLLSDPGVPANGAWAGRRLRCPAQPCRVSCCSCTAQAAARDAQSREPQTKAAPRAGGTGQKRRQLLSVSHRGPAVPPAPGAEAEPARGSARITLPKEQLLCLIWLPPHVCHLNNLSVFCSSQGLGRGCKECLEINHPCCVSRQGASPGFVFQPNPVPEPGIRNFMFPEDKEPQQTELLWGFCKVQHRKTTVEINSL